VQGWGNTVRVLLAMDDLGLRTRVETQLAYVGGISDVVLSGAWPEEMLLRRVEPDVVIVDAREGNRAERAFQYLSARSAVWAYVCGDSDVHPVAVAEHVSNVLSCDSSVTTLAAAVSGFVGGGTARRLPLSPREQEVLSLVARGLTNIQIAKSLYLSPTTVKGHISMILRKLGVANRVQATAFFTGQIAA